MNQKKFFIYTSQIKLDLKSINGIYSSLHWGINRLFFAKPPLNQQTIQAPPFLDNPPLYWFSVNPPKSQIFQ